MEYIVDQMKLKEAKEIVSWKYQGIYAFYNHTGCNEEVEQLIQGCYFSVKNELDELIGYYSFGDCAQVPNGHKEGAYDDPTYLDMGVGMNPKLVGKGLGTEFIAEGVKYVRGSLKISKVRLTVAEFNKRAIHTYQKLGFKKRMSFNRIRSNGEEIPFIVMLMDKESS